MEVAAASAARSHSSSVAVGDAATDFNSDAGFVASSLYKSGLGAAAALAIVVGVVATRRAGAFASTMAVELAGVATVLMGMDWSGRCATSRSCSRIAALVASDD